MKFNFMIDDEVCFWLYVLMDIDVELDVLEKFKVILRFEVFDLSELIDVKVVGECFENVFYEKFGGIFFYYYYDVNCWGLILFLLC